MKFSRLKKANIDFDKALDIASVLSDIKVCSSGAKEFITTMIEYYPENVTPQKLNQTISELDYLLNKLKGMIV